MTDKKSRVYSDWRRTLKQAGWEVDRYDSVKFNSGSETAKHMHAKMAGAHILKNAGYRVDTEVVHPERGEVDLAAIPTKESQKPYVIEFETSPTPSTAADKVERYVEHTPFVECYIVNLAEVSNNVIEMRKDIQVQL